LSRAFQEIAAPEVSNRRIGEIAASVGFRNVSAFSRMFHEAYGLTPGEARSQARKAVARPEYAVPAEPGESLSRWLEALAA
jgi:AraC-like DNA-binding protein